MRLPARDKTVWFSSRADHLLAEPPFIEPCRIRFGDLYVHYSAGDRKQIWLRNAHAQWESINLYHPHPYIAGYVLNIISSGEPSWVKSETIRTYEGRLKKRQREAEKTAAPAGMIIISLCRWVTSSSQLQAPAEACKSVVRSSCIVYVVFTKKYIFLCDTCTWGVLLR